jgi:hypothetical protein
MAAKRQNQQDVSDEQNRQLELPFTPGAAGEAQSVAGERVEADASPHSDQSQTLCSSMMQEVLEPANLGSALRQVQANKGSPGIDRGVGKDLAAQTAGSCHGPWRLANSPALSIALPNRFWDWLGIPRVAWNK